LKPYCSVRLMFPAGFFPPLFSPKSPPPPGRSSFPHAGVRVLSLLGPLPSGCAEPPLETTSMIPFSQGRDPQDAAANVFPIFLSSNFPLIPKSRSCRFNTRRFFLGPPKRTHFSSYFSSPNIPLTFERTVRPPPSPRWFAYPLFDDLAEVLNILSPETLDSIPLSRIPGS